MRGGDEREVEWVKLMDIQGRGAFKVSKKKTISETGVPKDNQEQSFLPSKL